MLFSIRIVIIVVYYRAYMRPYGVNYGMIARMLPWFSCEDFGEATAGRNLNFQKPQRGKLSLVLSDNQGWTSFLGSLVSDVCDFRAIGR